jgi:hypothetical protein
MRGHARSAREILRFVQDDTKIRAANDAISQIVLQYPPIPGDSIAPGDAAATGVASPSGVSCGAGVPTGAPNGASASCPYFIASIGRPEITFEVAGAGLSRIVSATP